MNQEDNTETNRKLYLDTMEAKKADRVMHIPNVMKFNLTLNSSVKDLVRVLFTDEYRAPDGKTYKNHSDYMMQNFAKDKEIVMTPFTPAPTYEAQVPSKRNVTFLHPVRERVMFAPEFAGCSATDYLYLFDQGEALWEREVLFNKIPYGDHFKSRSYIHLRSSGPNKCRLEYGFATVFIKKTVWQGKIESSSKSENIEYWDKVLKPQLLLESDVINRAQKIDSVADPQSEPVQTLITESQLMDPQTEVKEVKEIPMVSSDDKNIIFYDAEFLKRVDKLIDLAQLFVGLLIVEWVFRMFK